MYYFWLWTLPITLAVLNRLRGSDFKNNKKLFNIFSLGFLSTVAISAILGELTYNVAINKSYSIFLIMFALYMIGSKPGWGKWMGGLISLMVIKNRGFKLSELSEVNDWGLNKSMETKENYLWIHSISKSFFKDHENSYLNYCMVALTLRGFVWWFPVCTYMSYCKFGELTQALYYGLILGFAIGLYFPISIMYTAFSTKRTNGDYIWFLSEIVYGSAQGTFLFFYFL